MSIGLSSTQVQNKQAGGSGSAITAQDEGINLTTALALLNFVGAGVTATAVGNNVTVTVPGGGSATLSTALADTGTGAKSLKTATVTDATVSGASKLLVTWGNVLNTDENHPEMDDVSFFATPGTGQFTLSVASDHAGARVQGKYRINYTVG